MFIANMSRYFTTCGRTSCSGDFDIEVAFRALADKILQYEPMDDYDINEEKEDCLKKLLEARDCAERMWI